MSRPETFTFGMTLVLTIIGKDLSRKRTDEMRWWKYWQRRWFESRHGYWPV